MSEVITVQIRGSPIKYVYGTVNGEVVAWRLVGDAWQSVVSRAVEGVYVVVLTAVDEADNHATYTLTLRYGLSLVTDRTDSDVLTASTLSARISGNIVAGRDMFYGVSDTEREAWSRGLKGAYNASDLNRVEDAVRFIADLLREYGYTVPIELRGERWDLSEIPGVLELERYLGNVRAVMDSFYVLPTTPDLPETMAGLDVEGANAIEVVLRDVYYLIGNMATSFRYCGDYILGEDELI